MYNYLSERLATVYDFCKAIQGFELETLATSVGNIKPSTIAPRCSIKHTTSFYIFGYLVPQS